MGVLAAMPDPGRFWDNFRPFLADRGIGSIEDGDFVRHCLLPAALLKAGGRLDDNMSDIPRPNSVIINYVFDESLAIHWFATNAPYDSELSRLDSPQTLRGESASEVWTAIKDHRLFNLENDLSVKKTLVFSEGKHLYLTKDNRVLARTEEDFPEKRPDLFHICPFSLRSFRDYRHREKFSTWVEETSQFVKQDKLNYNGLFPVADEEGPASENGESYSSAFFSAHPNQAGTTKLTVTVAPVL